MTKLGEVEGQKKRAIENGHKAAHEETNGQTNGQQTSLEDCEMEVGAVVLRGNRMVLARSPVKKEWKGLQIPSLPLADGEDPYDCAMRAIERWWTQWKTLR